MVVSLLQIGGILAISLGGGTFLGVLADEHLGTSPLLSLLGMLCGIVLGGFGTYQVLRDYLKGQG